jgi:hypothetical protein
MQTALIGLIGVILGVILNEYFRRIRRTEQYSQSIFEKRLKAYEKLLELVNYGSDVSIDVIQCDDLTSKERHELISSVIMPIAEHVDRNALYIDEDLGPQCSAIFMGVEEIHDMTLNEKNQHLERYWNMLMETRRMIAEDSGVAKINRLFKSINQSKITGPFIERLRERRKEWRRDH